MNSFVGCDISKSKIDVTIHPNNYKRFDNDKDGHEALAKFIPDKSYVCMESTSTYFKPIAIYLKNNGHIVYVVNPLKVKRYGQSKLRRLKTDKADSWLIADYLVKNQTDLTPWQSTQYAQTILGFTVRVAESLMVSRGGQSSRIQAFSFAFPEIESSLESAKVVLQKETEHFYALAKRIIMADETLKRWYKALLKLPGFGPSLTLRFLGHCTDLRRFKSGRHFASFAGITPSENQTADTVNPTHISRIGSGRLRAILYLVGKHAARSKSKYGDLYKRLISQNKSKHRAYTALGNRIARAAWAVCVKPQNDKK